MEKRKVMFIVNLHSGIKKGNKCYRKIIKWLNENAEKKGIEPKIFFTERTGENNPVFLARKAVEEDYDRIIVVGGDGTIQQVANGVVGFNLPVGFIPAGSGNDFTRALGIPQNTEQALETAIDGKVKSIDVGQVNGKIFINVFGVGFDAKVAYYAEEFKRKWPLFSNTLLYLIVSLRELFIKLEYQHLEITFPNKKSSLKKMVGKVTFVLIANGPTCGGVFRLTPQAVLDDGLFDICWIKKASRLRIFKCVIKGIKGTHLNLPVVRKDSDGRLPRTSSLVISSLDKQPLPCQADGEILPSETEYRISILPGALKVLVP